MSGPTTIAPDPAPNSSSSVAIAALDLAALTTLISMAKAHLQDILSSPSEVPSDAPTLQDKRAALTTAEDAVRALTDAADAPVIRAFLVTGRVENDDDDSAYLVAAPDSGAADVALAEILREEADNTSAKIIYVSSLPVGKFIAKDILKLDPGALS